jgi:hypothetical protein
VQIFRDFCQDADACVHENLYSFMVVNDWTRLDLLSAAIVMTAKSRAKLASVPIPSPQLTQGSPENQTIKPERIHQGRHHCALGGGGVVNVADAHGSRWRSGGSTKECGFERLFCYIALQIALGFSGMFQPALDPRLNSQSLGMPLHPVENFGLPWEKML